jgi:hypothetical protein
MDARSERGRAARGGGALALVAAGLLAGCVRGAPRGGLITDPGRITGLLAARAARVRALRAHGSADVFNREGRKRGDVDLVVGAPDRVRFDIFGFGALFFSLVSDGQRFGLFQGRQYVVGPARACAARQIAGIALEAREIAAALSGGVPALGTPVGPVRWEEGRYVLDLRAPDANTARIELELPSEQNELPPARQTPRVVRVVLRDRDGVRADIRYESHRIVQGEVFPDRVRVLMERDGADLQVRLDRIELGEPPAPAVTEDPLAEEGATPAAPDPFRIAPPAGAELVMIDCR